MPVRGANYQWGGYKDFLEINSFQQTQIIYMVELVPLPPQGLARVASVPPGVITIAKTNYFLGRRVNIKKKLPEKISIFMSPQKMLSL